MEDDQEPPLALGQRACFMRGNKATAQGWPLFAANGQ